MIKNKRGLSAVVVTLIMILLGVVVAGIIWVVVQNVVESGTGQIGLTAKCMEINIEIESAACNINGTSCNVTLERKAGGDELGGVDLSYSNPTSGKSIEHDEELGVNEKQTFVGDSPNVTNVDTIQVIPYFLDESGNKQQCSQASDTFTDVNII